MTTTTNKYANGKIYKIVSDKTDKIYIGSTTRHLNIRLNDHRHQSKGHSCSSLQLFIIDPNCKIELIENYPCNSKIELHMRERFYILQNKHICVNIVVPLRTTHEWYIDNIEYCKITNYHYYNKHKHHIAAMKSQPIICKCGIITNNNHIRRHEKSTRHIRILMNKSKKT
jgi:hypothetical protein